MAKEEKQLTIDEILAALKDPVKLQTVIAATGATFPARGKKEEEEEEEQRLERPKFDLGEVSSLDELTAALSERFEQLLNYVESLSDEKLGGIKKELAAKEDTMERVRVNKFIDKIGRELFDKTKALMDPYYRQTGDLEKSFEIACKALDIKNPLVGKETKKGETKTNEEEAEARSSGIKSSEQEDTVKKSELSDKKPKNVREAAKSSLLQILEEQPELNAVASSDEV